MIAGVERQVIAITSSILLLRRLQAEQLGSTDMSEL